MERGDGQESDEISIERVRQWHSAPGGSCGDAWYRKQKAMVGVGSRRFVVAWARGLHGPQGKFSGYIYGFYQDPR
jgi:hypothetical protein